MKRRVIVQGDPPATISFISELNKLKSIQSAGNNEFVMCGVTIKIQNKNEPVSNDATTIVIVSSGDADANSKAAGNLITMLEAGVEQENVKPSNSLLHIGTNIFSTAKHLVHSGTTFFSQSKHEKSVRCPVEEGLKEDENNLELRDIHLARLPKYNGLSF